MESFGGSARPSQPRRCQSPSGWSQRVENCERKKLDSGVGVGNGGGGWTWSGERLDLGRIEGRGGGLDFGYWLDRESPAGSSGSQLEG